MFLKKKNNIIKIKNFVKKNYKHILVLSIIILLIIITIVLFSVLHRINISNKAADELSNQLKRITLQFIDDTAEIRDTLSLPTLEYENINSDENASKSFSTAENDINQSETILLDATDGIINTHIQNELYTQLTKILSNNKIYALFKKYQLDVTQKGTQLIIKKFGSIVARFDIIVGSNSQNKTLIKNFSFSSPVIEISQSSTIQKIIDFSTQDIDKFLNTLSQTINTHMQKSRELKNRINILLNNTNIKNTIKANGGYWKYNIYNNTYLWKFYTVLSELVLQITVNTLLNTLEIQHDTSYNINVNHSEKQIKKILLSTNFSPKVDRILEKKINEFTQIIAVLSQNPKLKAKKINITQTSHEDSDYVYFDISLHTNTLRIGAFAIQKSNATLWITDKDLVPLNSFNLDSNNLADGTSLYGFTKDSYNNTSENILLVGSHNGLSDTIILLHLNSHNKKVKMISIPRDLYYSGRKINWYFKRYSAKNFTSLMSKILAVPITKYVNVDMYSFVKVIDTLGGIPIYLEQDLIDPSYKIKENGVWSTLYYPKGEYILNGIEALRIARSRHSSTDFDRSSRQQLILSGLQQKIKSLNAFSISLLLVKIIREIKPYISTNISLKHMAKIGVTYKNSPIEKTVLSTKNVLYHTYSNLYNQNLLTEDVTEDFVFGQYILVPKNNNWEKIKKFIQDFIVQ